MKHIVALLFLLQGSWAYPEMVPHSNESDTPRERPQSENETASNVSPEVAELQVAVDQLSQPALVYPVGEIESADLP